MKAEVSIGALCCCLHPTSPAAPDPLCCILQRELRQLQLRLAQLESSTAPQHAPGQQQRRDGSEEEPLGGEREAGAGGWAGGLDLLQVAFPLRPIGLLHSCFSRRNGTPRQPLLVPAARARLTLRPGLSADFFAGLQQYSHCWLLYVFHENTDLQRLWSRDDSGVRAKIRWGARRRRGDAQAPWAQQPHVGCLLPISSCLGDSGPLMHSRLSACRVPRLDGGRLGVFATRSPHRPCPLGLSVAQVVGVEGRTLVLGGADVVDGSPVLDVKPFVPFCDNVPTAAAPAWVAAKVGAVRCSWAEASVLMAALHRA